ncbi:MAG: transposase [Candidatus Competibacteraceae bacterium]
MRLLDRVLVNVGLSQPFRRFLRELLMLLVIVPGRATFLNLSRYSDYTAKTCRRWFRRQVDWAQLNVTAIRAVVPRDHESVLAFDPSVVPKSGTGTAGLGRFWNGRAGRAEPGLELNTLAWVDVTANTAYTISAEMTPPEPAAAVAGATTADPAMATAEALPAKPTPRARARARARVRHPRPRKQR